MNIVEFLKEARFSIIQFNRFLSVFLRKKEKKSWLFLAQDFPSTSYSTQMGVFQNCTAFIFPYCLFISSFILYMQWYVLPRENTRKIQSQIFLPGNCEKVRWDCKKRKVVWQRRKLCAWYPAQYFHFRGVHWLQDFA